MDFQTRSYLLYMIIWGRDKGGIGAWFKDYYDIWFTCCANLYWGLVKTSGHVEEWSRKGSEVEFLNFRGWLFEIWDRVCVRTDPNYDLNIMIKGHDLMILMASIYVQSDLFQQI